MINLYNARLENIFVHKVGNKSKGEELFLSEFELPCNDEIRGVLKEYFLKPFRKADENYFNFYHDADLEFNTVYNACVEIFNNPDNLDENSKAIAQHLHSQSMHPHIKSGEVYVVYMEGVELDNEKMSAIGIFKSEIKKDFMNFQEGSSRLEMELTQGIDLSKLDKGIIIFNKFADDGFKTMTVDSNKYDTRYWVEDFLGLEVFEDENFKTKKYLKMVQDFGKEVVLPAEDKLGQLQFQSKSLHHFAMNDEFDENTFIKEVFDNPELENEFKHFKTEKGPKYRMEDVSGFDISDSAVTTSRKKFKNLIKLDTGIQIKIDFISEEKFENLVEKGWDEEKQMYYYLTYFNKEEK